MREQRGVSPLLVCSKQRGCKGVGPKVSQEGEMCVVVGGWLLKDERTERERLHLDRELFPAKWRLFSLKDEFEGAVSAEEKRYTSKRMKASNNRDKGNRVQVYLYNTVCNCCINLRSRAGENDL